MADTQTIDPTSASQAGALATQAAPSSFDDMLGTDKTKQLTSDLTTLYEKKSKEDSGLAYGEQKAISRREAEMERAQKQEAATINDLKPWNADEEMSKRSHSPMEEFGSFATIFSIAASAFTHTPATNAMNAAASYMNAVNAGDAEGYNKAFQAFKENSDLALKRADLEHRQFEDDAKLLDVDMLRARVALEASAAKFNDKKTLALLRADMLPEVIQAQEAKRKAAEGWAEAMPKIEEANLRLNFIADKMKQQEQETGKPATHADQLKYMNEFDASRAEAKRAGLSAGRSTISPAYREEIRTDLETALGHTLSPELNSSLDSAYGAKGVNAARIVSSVNRAIESIKNDLADGKPEQEIDPAKRINDAITAASVSSGRSAATAFIQKYQLEHPDATAADVQHVSALYGQALASAHTLGSREANVTSSVNEAKDLAKKAIESSKKVPRGNIVPFTTLQQLTARSTSNPEQKEFDTWNAGLITAYSQTMSRTGQNTVTAQNRAMDILSTATGPEAYARQAKVLIEEMEIVKQGVRDAESELLGDKKPTSPDLGGKPKTVIQNGYTYELQPDGSYK
jgi:hypothetical protein